jgi:outer membrane receptor protein involved in Fe transport
MLLVTLAALVCGADDLQTVVTGTRTERDRDDTPIATVVLTHAELERSPTLFTDDLLRQLPSVQTFRRSSSLTADPTSQGLSLRGVGPSGVSRAVLLVDGVPINDGFGGWIYWRSLARLGLDHAEVVAGPASAQYGSGALGGVVQLLSRPVTPFSVDAEAEAGTQDTQLLAARVAGGSQRLAGAVELEGARSDGYPLVTPGQRGAIDRDAPSAHLTANGRLEASLDHGARALLTGTFFEETEDSGTPASGARVRLGRAVLGVDWAAAGSWRARLFGSLEQVRQTRTRVSPTRDSEVLTNTQLLDLDDVGLSVQWQGRPLEARGRHLLSAGFDGRSSGGLGQRQESAGLFVQDAWKLLPMLEVVGALRGDVWHNGTRWAQAVSPMVAVHGQLRPGVSLRGSLGRAFRAPTLNELYRPFQVGSVLTAANAALGPETLFGGDVGVTFAATPWLALHVTGFGNLLDAPIVSVTLGDGTRQRQNLGQARIIGLEAGAECRFAHVFDLALAWTLVDARVTAGPTGLVGLQLAQDPAHRATVSLTYSNRDVVTVMVQLRVLGAAFEDDRNTLPIDAVALIDASASRYLGKGFELFVAVQNLLGTRYVVGRAGVDTVGPPFSAHGGVRLRSAAW